MLPYGWGLILQNAIIKLNKPLFQRGAREIVKSSGEPRHLSTIPLKNFHLFKIAESVINFCLKKFSN